MDLRRTVIALLAGTAALLLVGVAVTAVLEPQIEFSLFIGLPVGIVAGIVVTAFVAITLTDPDPIRYAAGVSTAAAGIAVLGTTFLGVMFRYRLTVALYTAVAAGVAVAVVTFVLARRDRLPTDR